MIQPGYNAAKRTGGLLVRDLQLERVGKEGQIGGLSRVRTDFDFSVGPFLGIRNEESSFPPN